MCLKRFNDYPVTNTLTYRRISIKTTREIMNKEFNISNDGNLLVSTDQSLLNLELITDFLTHTYWGKEMRPVQIIKAIKNSFCFGLYDDHNQVGFARVITDHVSLAWLADVFVLPDRQRKGYGQFLMNKILQHPQTNRRKTMEVGDKRCTCILF
jgi:GNAT superfamily N-acetyltransferase